MMTSEKTVQTLAAEALRHFEYTGENPPNGLRPNIYIQRSDAPEWLESLVYDAHGDYLPDDWRYSFIVEALRSIQEDGEDAELEADIYNGELLEWLGSNLTRAGYVDEATEEFGYPGNIMAAIQLGQWQEKQEVLASVLSSLEALAEEDDEDED